MPQVDSQLVANLKLVKTTPMRFAFVTNGPAEGRLLLAKMPPVPPKEIAEAKKQLGGGHVYLGRCRWENDQYVFELAKEPPGTLVGLVLGWLCLEDTFPLLNHLLDFRAFAQLAK